MVIYGDLSHIHGNLPTQNPFKITQYQVGQSSITMVHPPTQGPAIKWTSSPCPWASVPAVAMASFITGEFVGLEWMIHKLYSWGYKML